MKDLELRKLEEEIRAIEDYLGPQLGFHDNHYHHHRKRDINNSIVWILKYLDVLKNKYYSEIKRKKKLSFLEKMKKGIKRINL